MGKRRIKKWDWPWEGGGSLAVLGLSFLLGGGTGVMLAALAGGDGGGQLRDYLADYLLLAGQSALPGSLWLSLWGYLRCLLAVLVLGMTALGAVGLPVLFAARGFFFAFSVGCFCRVFGGAGLFPAFALFGLSALLWVPALFLAGVPGLTRARGLLGRSLGGGGGPSVSPVSWGRAALCGGLVLAAAAAERWVVPALLRAAAQVVL